jgi:hypothetical protein
MPSIQPGSGVLVTGMYFVSALVSHIHMDFKLAGASGYLGSWICLTLLKRGFSVRACVQSEQEGKHLIQILEASISSATRFSYVVVPDIREVSSLP